MNMNNAVKANHFLSRSTLLARLRRHSRGQTLVEYALILAIISVVAIGVMISLGQQVKGVLFDHHVGRFERCRVPLILRGTTLYSFRL